jgi:hypothetical protein
MGMMQLETNGIIGALLGLGAALFGNLVVLPWVLKAQRNRRESDASTPMSGWDRIALMTKFNYRIVMPLLFGFIGYEFGTTFMGAK